LGSRQTQPDRVDTDAHPDRPTSQLSIDADIKAAAAEGVKDGSPSLIERSRRI